MRLLALITFALSASMAVAAPSIHAGTFITVTDADSTNIADGSTVDFGVMDLGGLKTLNFTVTNTSAPDSPVPSVSVDGADAPDFVFAVEGNLLISAPVTRNALARLRIQMKLAATIIWCNSTSTRSSDFNFRRQLTVRRRTAPRR